ncbi:MAG: type I DNA topoisomerase [candidate division WOR-3 bacterium]|nr:type I DNA topoisomerase [candidate division WOR-3 bacterium]
MRKSSKLLIVESPTKAHTIKRLLKDRFNVLSSKGHIKDLPKSKLGVDIEQGFTPHYITIRGKAKIINELKNAAKKAQIVYLGCDPDREGEAIAFHIAEEISKNGKNINFQEKSQSNGKNIKRVLFYEITKTGIEKGLANPTEIDQNKVAAHTARRVLDRLVGYLVSPILWKTIRGGLSAGRVQTVALRLIVEREREIQNFIPEEYWLIKVVFKTKHNEEFSALLVKIDGKEEKISNESSSQAIKKDLEAGLEYFISKLHSYEKHNKPPPPFITATLQQEASRKLGFSSKKTMFIAQQLFEGIKLKDEETGLITYPRTDSLRVAEEFINSTRNYITEKYGDEYLPPTARKYKDRSETQGAHEAIRPTSIHREPSDIKAYLTPDQFKLYDLIYRRFLASQMNDSIYLMTDVEVVGGKYTFQAQGVKQKFAGFEKVYGDGVSEKDLPLLKNGDQVYLKSVNPEQHFTQPPARYSEASLIKKLQINGIGRPSTYATIVSTIMERKYVEKKQGRLLPTRLGFIVNDILISGFDNIFEVGFTKKMEKELDLIEANKVTWQKVINDFYLPFKEDLEKIKNKTLEIKRNNIEELKEKCPECGKPLVKRWGRYGQFVACSGYPDCKYIKKEENKEPLKLLDTKCPECGKPLTERISRYGKFIACSGYPECKYIQQTPKPEPVLLDEKCPKCGKQLVERKGRFGKFIACSGYPECEYKAKIKAVSRSDR